MLVPSLHVVTFWFKFLPGYCITFLFWQLIVSGYQRSTSEAFKENAHPSKGRYWSSTKPGFWIRLCSQFQMDWLPPKKFIFSFVYKRFWNQGFCYSWNRSQISWHDVSQVLRCFPALLKSWLFYCKRIIIFEFFLVFSNWILVSIQGW